MNNKVKFELKPGTLVLIGVLIGALVTSVIFLAVGNRTVIDYRVDEGGQVSATTAPTTEPKNYRTDLRGLLLNTEDTSFTMKVPNKLYNLSDQYADAMNSYYGTVKSVAGTLTFGNAEDLNSASIMVSASPLSVTRSMIKELNPTFTEEELDKATYSDAYILMTTGELPEHAEGETPMDVTLIESQLYQDTMWNFYELNYTQSYYTNEEQTETLDIPIHELAVYSEGNDSVEIIAYDSTGDTDIQGLINLVKEMLTE